MIVDCHTHLWSYPGHLSEEFVAEANLMRSEPVEMNVDPDKHFEAMEQVDRAIVLAFRATASGINVPNDFIAEYVGRAPEKLIGFLSVEPQQHDPAGEIERAVFDLGMKGIKLGPIYQHFHPNDPMAYPIYAKAQELGLPILFHQGTTFPRKAPLKYAHPILLEDVALRFPELVMIIAHLGHPWEAETLVLIRKQPNMYSDISALFYRPWQCYHALRLAMEYGVTHKLLFGTDYPVTTAQESIEGLYRISERMEEANLPELPKEVLDRIIHQDALKLLGIEALLKKSCKKRT